MKTLGLMLALSLYGCGLTYTTAAFFGDGTAADRIDLVSLVDSASMRAVGDSSGVSRVVLYHYPGFEAEAATALADMISIRNTAHSLLRTDRLPDIELYLLHVPERAALVWEQSYPEARSLEDRTFGTVRFPLPYQEAPSPPTDFYYQPATYVLAHELVELTLVNELGSINHKEGCRWFFEGTADYVAQTWQVGQGVARAKRDQRAGKVWLWLVGEDLLKWGEYTPDEGAGYYLASTQAVTNLVKYLRESGIDDPIPHIIERSGPNRMLHQVIRDVTGHFLHELFRVPDQELEQIKAELLDELASDDAVARSEAVALLQRMSDRLSDGERDRVRAAAAAANGVS